MMSINSGVYKALGKIFKRERETCAECGGHIEQKQPIGAVYSHIDFGMCRQCFMADVQKMRDEMNAELRDDFEMGGM